tara:strand:- start:2191 stop:2931 length:741 start_codon:yes stop_codon:yes gene_type:complete
MSAHKLVIAGNWKMNGDLSKVESFADEMDHGNDKVEVILFPPSVLISATVSKIKGAKIGGQNIHSAESGAHTGELSAEMLKQAECTYVLCGHSERRANCHEGDHAVAAKALAAKRAGLIPVICIGENLTTREAGEHLAVVRSQMAHSVPESLKAGEFMVAYEPVWAIGTGKTASVSDIQEMHDALNADLEKKYGTDQKVPVLYGGSVKPDNAQEILSCPNVGGVLVGGASLKTDDFNAIIRAGNSV